MFLWLFMILVAWHGCLHIWKSKFIFRLTSARGVLHHLAHPEIWGGPATRVVWQAGLMPRPAGRLTWHHRCEPCTRAHWGLDPESTVADLELGSMGSMVKSDTHVTLLTTHGWCLSLHCVAGPWRTGDVDNVKLSFPLSSKCLFIFLYFGHSPGFFCS